MLHIKDGGKIKIDPVLFNESYMMYGSTSPQYSMIASLDVATKMMEDNGEAMETRKKMAQLRAEAEAGGDWFFDM